MKNSFSSRTRRLLWLVFFAVTLCFCVMPSARAGLTIDVHLYQSPGIFCFPYLSTNTATPNNPSSSYFISSPSGSIHGELDAGAPFSNPGSGGFNTLGDLIQELTNGNWTLLVTNNISTNQYSFRVSVAGITTNMFSPVTITFPANEAVFVTNTPTFTWQGPTNWPGTLSVFDDFTDTNGDDFNEVAAGLPPTQMNLPSPVMLPDGTNLLIVDYQYNVSATVIASTPTNASQSLSGWVSTATLETYAESQFIVGLATNALSGGHTLVAHYTFDDANNVGADSSGNGYFYNSGSGSDGGSVQATTNAETGGGALDFSRDTSDPFSAGIQGWYPTTPPAILSALAGSFSVSVWVKTTNSIGDPGDFAYNGSAVIAADVGGLANDTIPIALTGGEVAFNTGGDEDDTLNSSGTVNDGSYHHIVVTRDQATGDKAIYIDGVLDSTSSGTTKLLNDPQSVVIGAIDNAGSPTFSSFYGGFDGEMDDLQIYSGVLSSTEIASLHDNPGTTAANVAGQDFDTALDTTNLIWTTGGDTNWFIETAITHDGVSAAQSGLITDGQASHIETTVPADGQISFYWKVSSETNFDYLTFYINGNEQDAISGEVDWNQETYSVQAGDVLRWEYTKDPDCCSGGLDAGFLDQVSFVAFSGPVITLNPFDQTNYPGYNVALLAAATNSDSITWEWFKVGSTIPIPNATSALFIPTNSGTSGVQGSYYAVASDDAGSANTTTASVSFVSAQLPPDWSRAFKSSFSPVDEDNATKDFYYGCIVDTNGNLYVAAEFGGNTMVGSSNLNSGVGGDAAAIVKQSPTGSPLWAVGITNNGSGSSFAQCVAPAPGGGVYLAGNYSGNNWLGTNKLTDAGSGDMFLARFDANGSNIWVKTFGGTNADFLILNSLAADPSGNVTLAGLLGSGPATIGSSNYNVVGQEGVLIQLDQNGSVRWSQLQPNEFVQYLVYSAGRLYASLSTTTSGGTTNVVIGGISNITDRAWAIACLNETNGNAIWTRGVGAQSGSASGNPFAVGLIDDVPRLAVSGTNIFLTGVAYDSSASFGAITVNFGDLRGQYFARYDTNGNAQVATTYGSVTTTPIAAVANANGDVYVSGYFDTFSFFGNDMIAAPANARPNNGGFSQGFLAKFDRNGNPLWAREAVSPATVNLLGIALATDGVWASGWSLSGQVPPIESTAFGTNNVFSDGQFLHGGAGGSTVILWFPAGVLAKITETTATPTPVTLLNPQDNGANFQFQFLSQSGFNHAILYRTNLAVGIWQTNSTVSGDGTVKTISVPLSLFNGAKQGFIRVSTQ